MAIAVGVNTLLGTPAAARTGPLAGAQFPGPAVYAQPTAPTQQSVSTGLTPKTRNWALPGRPVSERVGVYMGDQRAKPRTGDARMGRVTVSA
jgi:hypothetical protein